jgi:hypothetical protein
MGFLAAYIVRKGTTSTPGNNYVDSGYVDSGYVD